ncbi:hypothetical protein [Gordonia sp. OPL2]|uniref:hypothetical protein n=1 Tax=Gordonia sp. OPL2 TaxID=2486274 RepID=UPI001655264D|nr:hypothetical protein [Gordonia sp. OPL2]RPA06116.1 hypothetical protein EEB19_09565 [Gordonia sp. OPL2]
MDQPTAEEALRELQPLVGDWTVAAHWPNGEPWPGGGSMSVEWLPTRQLLIQRTSMDLPEAPDTVAVIGCDAANGTYTQLYSDSRGVCRIYQMSIADGEWRLWRNGEPFAQRFVGRFGADGRTITGQWEAAEAGEYRTDFDLVYTRVS